MKLEVNIKKNMGDFFLDVEFSMENEILALFGPSGSGKSMTLKCISGIEKPDSGRIVLGDRVLFDSENKINLTPQERHIGHMFQDYALFPHMTVKRNLETVSDSREEVEEYIERFKLKEIENLYPWQISGGQKQRTAMARMLITKPELILLDEPFNAMDDDLKEEMEKEILEILNHTNKPAVFVSHNRQEVEFMTGREVVLKRGR